MRGVKAKKLRALAYADTPVMKYSRNREYSVVVCPGQWRHKLPLTIIADNQRAFYQMLKGRRTFPDGTYMGEVPAVCSTLDAYTTKDGVRVNRCFDCCRIKYTHVFRKSVGWFWRRIRRR